MNKITNATIFVTGGAGFIGSYVIEELLLNYQANTDRSSF